MLAVRELGELVEFIFGLLGAVLTAFNNGEVMTGLGTAVLGDNGIVDVVIDIIETSIIDIVAFAVLTISDEIMEILQTVTPMLVNTLYVV